MIKTLIGRNEDGSPHYNYTLEEGDDHIVVTGVGMGLVQLADGTLVDVTEPVIVVQSPEHASEIAHHIAVQAEKSGQLDVRDPHSGELLPYQHTDCDHCDAPKTAETDPLSPQAKRQQELIAAHGPGAAEDKADKQPTRKGKVT